VQERLVSGDGSELTPVAELYEDYRAWMEARGFSPVSVRVFGRLMNRLGWTGVRVWRDGKYVRSYPVKLRPLSPFTSP